MALILNEQQQYYWDTGDTLPTVDVKIGTLAYHITDVEWSEWDGTVWVVSSGNHIIYKASTDTYTLPTTLDDQTQNLGQEMFFNGKDDGPVSVNVASSAANPTVWLAGNSVVGDEEFFSMTNITSDQLFINAEFGMNTTTITEGGKGKISVYGELNGVDTSAWAVGARLYVDANIPGAVTDVKPASDIYFVGIVKKSDVTTGIIFVNTVHASKEDLAPVSVSSILAFFTGDPALNNQLITNGDFTTASDWVAGVGWTVGGGFATNDGLTTNELSQVVVIVPATTYRVTLDTSSGVYANTGLLIALGSNSASDQINADGNHSFDIVAGGDHSNIVFDCATIADFAGSITNVSIREISPYYGLAFNQGIVPSVSQQIVVNDNSTDFVALDSLGFTINGGVVNIGQIAGQIECDIDTDVAQEQLIMEIYKSDIDGVVIDAGTGLPNGDLGVPPIVVMTSSVINMDGGFTYFIPINGYINTEVTLAVNERARYHIGASKIGATGGPKTFNIYQGADHDTHIELFVPIQAIDVSYSNTTSGMTATNVQTAIDELADESVQWKGDYTHADTVVKNVMVLDAGWTMISNKTTSDSAAPQPTGQEENDLQGALFTIGSDVSIVTMIHNYTFTKNGWIKALAIGTAFWDSDVWSKITIANITAGTAEIISNPILVSGDSTILKVGSTVVSVGDVAKITYEYYNTNPSSTVTGGWTSNIGVGVPVPENFEINDAANPTLISIQHKDLDNVDRSSELNATSVVADSIIRINETADVTRSVEAKVVSAVTPVAGANGYTDYTVTLVGNGPANIRDVRTCTINIDVPISVPSDYNESVGHYSTQPSFVDVVTSLEYDGVDQAAATTTAYDINLTFQEAYISPDWDLVSAGGSGGGNSSSPGAIEVLTFTQVVLISSGLSTALNIGPAFSENIFVHGGYLTPTAVAGTVGGTDVNLYIGKSDNIDASEAVLNLRLGIDSRFTTANAIVHCNRSANTLTEFGHSFFRIESQDAGTWSKEYAVTVVYTIL